MCIINHLLNVYVVLIVAEWTDGVNKDFMSDYKLLIQEASCFNLII